MFVLKYSLFYIDSIVYSESTHLEYDIYNSCQHMLLWFGRCGRFWCGEDTGGGYLTNISLGGNF